ncbi:uncharacterized protein LOC116984070 [Amblyraja radiata]|uniref:uncharacterized protein LOC116984070 n=1 Tax=Amblyraja radiata TaxID=386614 RepID=UPI00140287BD|nr:uncharacterized protein LOC116984070 [Amblyraja radiata]
MCAVFRGRGLAVFRGRGLAMFAGVGCERDRPWGRKSMIESAAEAGNRYVFTNCSQNSAKTEQIVRGDWPMEGRLWSTCDRWGAEPSHSCLDINTEQEKVPQLPRGHCGRTRGQVVPCLRQSSNTMDSRLLLVFVCVWGVAKPHPSTGNLLATIRATQSSLLDFRGYALNAIDRNTDTNYEMGSCSSTKVEASPWWSVDMFYHYHVYVVKITAGHLGGGIRGASILIGDSAAVDGKGNQMCATEVNVPPGESAYVNCKPRGVHGRFMTITIPGKTACLVLCEVEAFGAHEPH